MMKKVTGFVNFRFNHGAVNTGFTIVVIFSAR